MKTITLRAHRAAASEDGFSFVELLVVVLIIGVLATLAIPSFFSVRERSWHAAAKSDVRNMTKYHTTQQSEGTFVLTVAGLTSAGFERTADVEHGVCGDEAAGLFAVAAGHDSHDDVWMIGYNGTLQKFEDTDVQSVLDAECGYPADVD